MGCLRLRGPARAIDVEKIIYDQSWLLRSHLHLHWEACRHPTYQLMGILPSSKAKHCQSYQQGAMGRAFFLKVGLLAGSPSDACEHTWKKGVAHN
jgi:hypothetical protein